MAEAQNFQKVESVGLELQLNDSKGDVALTVFVFRDKLTVPWLWPGVAGPHCCSSNSSGLIINFIVFMFFFL